MTEFLFTSPSGEKFKMTGPEGSTKEEAFEKFKSFRPDLFGGKKLEPPKVDVSPQEPRESRLTPNFAYQPKMARMRPDVAAKGKEAFKEKVTPEELGEQWKQFGTGAAIGVPSGIVGLPGDIESLARLPLSPLGVSRESFFPTSEKVGTSLFGEPESKEEKLGREAGSLLSPGVLAKGLTFGARATAGTPSLKSSRLAKEAEDIGIKLEPKQVRAQAPAGSAGLTQNTQIKNQEIYNRLASKETGVETNNITEKFLNDRLKSLGLEYDKIFRQDFKLTDSLANSVMSAADFEKLVRPAGSSRLEGIANNILNRFTAGETTIPGKELQQFRSELSRMSGSLNGQAANRSWELLREIDIAISKTDSQLAKRLQDTNKKYRATMTLKELASKADNPGIFNGQISPEILGAQIAGESNHPLAKLGELGRGLKLQAMYQKPEYNKSIGEFLTGKLFNALGYLGPRTQAARAIQRRMTPVGVEPRKRALTPSQIAALMAAGGRAVKPEEE